MSEDMGPMPSDKCVALPLDDKVPVYVFALDTVQTQEGPDKGFLFHVFTQVQNDIHSIF